ncbi:MAG TPA: tripartite tricarboxylate transporter substrate binding protein [Ramlibacter sp.]|nr:tripartite tricarboxylate transporter substrate binding protein [Ramlibacter sp.]
MLLNPIARGRRALVAAAALAAVAALLPLPVNAQAGWPNRPIKLVVPNAAGGGNDAVARALANKLSGRLGQPVVIENKGGAGGTLGTDTVAKAPPDGYTLLLASTSIATNAASGKQLPYDLARDLEPIGQIATSPLLIVVSSHVPTQSLQELLQQARAKPGTLSYGSGGVGAINHLAIELLAAEAKVQLMHVPYKGNTPAFTDLLGGNLHLLLTSPASAAQYSSSGRIRSLAVTSAQRSPFYPTVPTAAESGLPGFQVEIWWGLLGPAIVKRLNEELNWAMSQPDMRELLARDAATPKTGTPAALGQLISAELSRWTRLVKDANLRLE